MQSIGWASWKIYRRSRGPTVPPQGSLALNSLILIYSTENLLFYLNHFFMNFLPGEIYGVPHEISWKIMFAKKVTKLPDLTVHFYYSEGWVPCSKRWREGGGLQLLHSCCPQLDCWGRVSSQPRGVWRNRLCFHLQVKYYLYSSSIPVTLNWIADAENHPSPEECGGIDYASIYR